MSSEPDLFYVQSTQAYDEEALGELGPKGWRTFPHCFQDRRDAERQMASLEQPGARTFQVQSDEGEVEDVTEQIATVYRVVSTSELRGEGPDALQEAHEATKHHPEGFPPGSGQVGENDDA